MKILYYVVQQGCGIPIGEIKPMGEGNLSHFRFLTQEELRRNQDLSQYQPTVINGFTVYKDSNDKVYKPSIPSFEMLLTSNTTKEVFVIDYNKTMTIGEILPIAIANIDSIMTSNTEPIQQVFSPSEASLDDTKIDASCSSGNINPLTNNETYLSEAILQEIYADNYSKAISTGLLHNNSFYSYTLIKLRQVYEDIQIINKVITAIEPNTTIQKILIKSISSLSDLDKLIRGNKILLQISNINLSIVEATYTNNHLEITCNETQLDKEVLTHMLEYNLYNYNLQLQQMNSSFPIVKDCSDKLLCPEYLVYPNGSQTPVGLVVTNIYISENQTYFIPMASNELTHLRKLQFTEELNLGGKFLSTTVIALDEQYYLEISKPVSLSNVPKDVKSIGDINRVIELIGEGLNIPNLTLLPEIDAITINKEVATYYGL